MITVRLPSALRSGPSDTLTVSERVSSIEELVDVLELRIPGLRVQLDDSVFNFAVNDELLLHHVAEHSLNDGDIVEIVPTISGG